MKKFLSLVLWIMTIVPPAVAQLVPRLQWQRCFGSNSFEQFGMVYAYPILCKNSILTLDGAFLIGATTHTLVDNGDVIGPLGDGDIWVGKVDTSRQFIWQKCLGGDSIDRFGSIITCPDGGFIVCGHSYSSVVGGSANKGDVDAYVIKLNSSGSIEWQKLYGGSRADAAYNIQPTSDGGYIFCGRTNSADGDVAGWHNSGATLNDDTWVVKLNSSGNIQWQKCLGGTGKEIPAVVQPLPSGGYLVVSTTTSYDGDVNISFGDEDFWAVHLSASGSIVWEKTYGGQGGDYCASVAPTPDHGFLIAGSSLSGICQPQGGFLNIYGLVVKISSNGTLEWQKCYRTDSTDEILSDIKLLPDGKFVVAGHKFMVNQGLADAMVIKCEANGDVIWRKYVIGNVHDVLVSIAALNDGDLIAYGSTSSSSGDVSGFHGVIDAWMVKLGGTNTIKGSIFSDANLNGIKEASEQYIDYGSIVITKNSDTFLTTPRSGRFSLEVDTGNYVTRLKLPNNSFIAVPSSHNSSFTNYTNKDSFSFAVQRGATILRDLKVNLVPLTPARPGFPAKYRIIYANIGNESGISGKVRFIKTSQTSFVSAIPAASSQTADTVEWNFSNFNAFDSSSIEVTLLVKPPPVVSAGNTIKSIATISSTGGVDISPDNDTAVVRQTVIGSYDPNDKKENFGGRILPSEIAAGKFLNYTIRFQNTGTDTAYTVLVRDTLDSKVDINTFEMTGASHSYHLIKVGNKLVWEFRNILLPDSNVSEQSSHGFVAYRIKPKNTLVIGDSIQNVASIYFDFNLPVKTNKEVTKVVAGLAPPLPVVSGIQTQYCINQGIQKGKIENLPLQGPGVSASVKLNGGSLPILPDSTFSFNVDTVSTGTSLLMVVFTNVSGSDTMKMSIAVSSSVTPDVNISANVTNITSLANPVIVTATNFTGGGPAPLYTFALNRTFTSILQAESSNSIFNLNPANLQVGDNWIYVRMKTSLNCSTSPTSIDSILLTRDAVTGIVDVNDPGRVINIFPNPFSRQIHLTGLNAAKRYEITVVDFNGNVLFRNQVQGTTQFNIELSSYSAGVYILNLYDKGQQRIIGSMRMLKFLE